MAYDWQPLILPLKLASVTTTILVVLGIPLGYTGWPMADFA
jgi:ABC-type molybdate transport system permease subunit